MLTTRTFSDHSTHRESSIEERLFEASALGAADAKDQPALTARAAEQPEAREVEALVLQKTPRGQILVRSCVPAVA